MATITQASSKYRDLVSKSVRIAAGCPAVYQLKPDKDQIGTLTRLSVGERKPNQTNKTILLVGETGTGKSTLINALFNHSLGVTWEDEVWFQIVEEDNGSQSGSQTSDVVVYQIFGGTAQPFSLTIIDTPGYGDTRGIERDAAVSERLLDLFRLKDCVRQIHAVGLVMKSSECRLSDRLLYAFNSVTSLFGKDLERNIVALLTYSDGTTPENALNALKEAKIKCAQNEENEPTHFLFNNRQKSDRTKNKASLEFAWSVTKEGMEQFTGFLERTPPQTLDDTVKVLHQRIRLTACIQNLQGRVTFIELKQKEIQQTQEAVEKHEVEIEKGERFTYKVDEPYKCKEAISGGLNLLLMYSGATCCTVCEETCHYPGCTVAWYPSQCEVMSDGKCTVCTGRCPASSHVKDEWRYVTKTRRVEKTNTELKEKFKTELLNKSKLLQDLKEQESKMTEEKRRLLDEAYQHVDSLEKIALNVDSVSTYVHYDFLIEKMKERRDQEKVQRLEGIKRRVEKGNQSALGYAMGKLRGITGAPRNRAHPPVP